MAGAVQSLDGSRKEWWKIPIQQAELSLGLACEFEREEL